MNTPTMTKIESSNIAGAAHQFDTLYLKFHSGQVYQYDNVPETVFHELVAAPSAGVYFHHHIRGKFHYQKLEVAA